MYKSADANSVDDNKCGELYRLSKKGSHQDINNTGY